MGLINPKVDAGTGSHVGSLVGSNAGTIINCNVESGSVSGNQRVGGLVGGNTGTITNCYTTASVSGNQRVGGLVGYNYFSNIANCYSSSSVSGDFRVGGLVGENRGGIISSSCSNGSVSGDEDVGGLVGFNWSTITNCYATDSVSGNEKVGGLVGYNNHGTIFACYSFGRVLGTASVGGLIGIGGGACSSYWDTQTSGQTSSAGGTGRTTSEMQRASTFIGWGYDPVWTIDEGLDYPRLWWENMPGERITTPSSFESVAGSGTETDPYLIYTSEELNMIGQFPNEWDKYFILMADIDLGAFTDTDFSVIGRPEWPFTGVFDGNGHKISNFIYDSNDTNYIGIFAEVDDSNAEIKDLALIDPNIDAGTGNYVGSLIGRLTNGTIAGCYVEGGTVSGDEDVGGLVGFNRSTITNCYTTGGVSGNYNVGGLVGDNYWPGTITNCYSVGSFSGDEDVGGLVGYNEGTITNCYSSCSVSGDEWVGGLVGWSVGTITNCYSNGSISGNENVGGLVGQNGECPMGDYLPGTISNCYSTGSVSGNEKVGGLVGDNWAGTITNCYAIGRVTGTQFVGGLVGNNDDTVIFSLWDVETSGQISTDGGMGKTTAEMQMASTFLDAGWDFVDETANGTEDIWWIDEGQDYPRLLWELIPEN